MSIKLKRENEIVGKQFESKQNARHDHDAPTQKCISYGIFYISISPKIWSFEVSEEFG